MLLTSAGVSKGDYDIVKDVLAKQGKIDFWSIRMKPAKPLAFGTIHLANKRQIPHIGLPGNPVSALVACEQLVRPAILKMLGQTNLKLPTITATLQDTITNDDGRRVYARVIVTEKNGEYLAKLTGHQGSNILTSMVQANGLAICPEDVQRVPAGSQVSVELLNWPN
jgi:molybdopterin molybdotransferase